jgi:hypothetical protein
MRGWAERVLYPKCVGMNLGYSKSGVGLKRFFCPKCVGRVLGYSSRVWAERILYLEYVGMNPGYTKWEYTERRGGNEGNNRLQL